ncbi:MAG: 2-oxoacid:acceptor oxidoreductase subunit alpha [Desulfobacterales bacterium]|jgi:2-oxoglutarate ferredoxin oxidoreductase subunit alpha|nr:2-oxoacid:acceptor oxidoreductase subunit alpha [Desulfobacterales bacterium]
MVPELNGKKLLLQGNEAMVEGAIAAGCRFYAGYPITPASEISERMSYRLPQVDGTFIQMEDEISSLGAVIGASLAGVKSMTATSGPGFSLMQENLGYACMTEVPCVVVNVMRGGPSTGLPTSPAQGDVMQARWGTHGDHPIIVLSVASVSECFSIIVTAFNLSEKYRVPVIVLSDEVVAHSRETFTIPPADSIEVVDRIAPNVPPEWYKPYEDNSRGVPTMSSMGDGYRHHVTGLVHDADGFPTDKPGEIEAFTKRQFRKITNGFFEIQITKKFNLEDAEIVVIAYGSVARSARHAVAMARAQGIKAGLIQLVTIFPFPKNTVVNVMRQCKAVLVPEMNMGQISREVKRVNPGTTEVFKYNRIDGQLITPQEIFEEIQKI